MAELLLERYGVLTREHVLAEGVSGGLAGLYDQLIALETLGKVRRGYFIEGLGGAQFALPGAVERLRQQSKLTASPTVLAATDPAQPYGAILPWPPTSSGVRPKRVAGAAVVLVAGAPVIYVERGGRGLVTFTPYQLADDQLRAALSALAAAVQSGQLSRLALERFNGEAIVEAEIASLLIELGCQLTPRKLLLSA